MIGPPQMKLKRAACLNSLARRELETLPDFRVHGKEFGLPQIVAHALEPLVSARVDWARFRLCRRQSFRQQQGSYSNENADASTKRCGEMNASFHTILCSLLLWAARSYNNMTQRWPRRNGWKRTSHA